MAYVSNIQTKQPSRSTGLGIDRLQALQAFNARLVCMTVNESSYEEVVTGVWKVLGCDACALFLVDESANELVLVGSVGYSDVPADLRISLTDPDSIHAQSLLEEYLIHVDGSNGAKSLSDQISDNLVLPIISNSGPVGVFDFASFDADTFDGIPPTAGRAASLAEVGVAAPNPSSFVCSILCAASALAAPLLPATPVVVSRSWCVCSVQVHVMIGIWGGPSLEYV
jgi:hypothetical protein